MVGVQYIAAISHALLLFSDSNAWQDTDDIVKKQCTTWNFSVTW